jgi:hypothetical protein
MFAHPALRRHENTNEFADQIIAGMLEISLWKQSGIHLITTFFT